MRAAALMLALVCAVAGCGSERCHANTALVTFTLPGTSRDAQQLVVRASVAGHDESTKSYAWHGAADGSVELTFKSGYQAGQHVSVGLYAERDNRLIGSAAGDFALTPGCSVLRLTIVDFDAGGDPDGGAADDLGIPSGPCAGASDGTECAPTTNPCQSPGRCLKGVCGAIADVHDGTQIPGGQYIDRCCKGQPVKLNSDDNCGGCGLKCHNENGFHCVNPEATKEQQWWCSCNVKDDCWSGCCGTGTVPNTATRVCAPSSCDDTAICTKCPDYSICVMGTPHYYCEYP